MKHWQLILILVSIRIFNALTIKTFFQPDEYWQSLEPAHTHVYGYGFQTWEWRERLRSAAHPLVYAGIFKLADKLGIDIVIAPKIFQGIVAALGDYYQYVLAKRILGGEGGNIALIASIGSAFNWFCITRTFSNSFEMVLTTIALAFWPWNGKTLLNDWSYRFALFTAALSCVFRPTNVLLWIILGVRLVYQTNYSLKVIFTGIVSVITAVTVNFWIDFYYYGEPVLPLFKFLEFNIVQSLSQFYGISPWHYYIVQGIPILLIAYLPITVMELYKSKTSIISQTIFIFITLYSFLAHKEVRFIYPLLPLLHLLFAKGVLRIEKRKINKLLALAIAINAPVAFYFTQYHQRGVIDVVDYIRNDPQVLSVGFLMPCHSTPWQSHIHRNIPSWFLTCEPPIHSDTKERGNYLDIADLFYEDPIKFLDNHFPGDYGWPSHLAFFKQLEPIVGEYLQNEHYRPHKSFFNSHFHDDWRRVGDVVVYKRVL